jgi:hypothetical protein
MQYNRFAISTIITTLILQYGSAAAGAAPSYNVAVIAIPCKASLDNYRTKLRTAPDVYLDKLLIPSATAISETTFDADSLEVRLSVDQGFHHVTLVAPYGAATVEFDVVPNHKRTLTVSLCRDLFHYDQAPSVTVLLPLPGLSPYVLVDSSTRGKAFEQMTVQDGVAYATSIEPGAISLVVPYTSHGQYCVYLLSDEGAARRNPHLRFRLSTESMATGSRTGECGALEGL